MRYLLIVILLFLGCDDNPASPQIEGCTNSSACNYDDTATIDNGTCTTNVECGVCGGDGIDIDSDGICDDVDDCIDIDSDNLCDEVDDCVGEYDSCGICNGSGYDCGGSCNNEYVEVWNECYNIQQTTLIQIDYWDFSEYGFLSIPIEVGELINLTRLYIDGPTLTGTIPNEIGNLINLEYLTLNGSAQGGYNLSGSIPTSIGNLINLKQLNLKRNTLSGAIPSEIGNLINLERLSLYDNELTSVPSEIGNLINLEYLDLSNNEIQDVASEICNQGDSGFDITNNYICPPFPSCFYDGFGQYTQNASQQDDMCCMNSIFCP